MRDSRVRRCRLPANSLLRSYQDGANYVDCYTTLVTSVVAHEAFVRAFYTSWLFTLERWILSWAVAKPSTDAGAADLAAGATESFAAWRLEARAPDQLLMCDFLGNTRLWLMSAREDASTTRLYFGSAVVAKHRSSTGAPSLGFRFRALLGFHRLYSRLLLRAARARVED